MRGCVRGIVAASAGLLYIGIDVSQRQVDANEEQLRVSGCRGDLTYDPIWVVGDGESIATLHDQLDPAAPLVANLIYILQAFY